LNLPWYARIGPVRKETFGHNAVEDNQGNEQKNARHNRGREQRCDRLSGYDAKQDHR